MADEPAGVYVYGVIRDGTQPEIDAPPIAGTGPVYIISRGGLAAVVSDGPLRRYELVRQNIRGHQGVIDCVMQATDILPTRLGAMLPSAKAVAETLLEKRREELEQLLERVQGRVELGLKVSWTDLQRVFREITAADQGLRALRDRLARRPSAATYEARIDLGDRAARALSVKREQEADKIAAALARQAVSVCRNDVISELMVLNGAFLVERTGISAFETAVQELDGASDGRLEFMLAGPLPAYNFVCVSTEYDSLRQAV